MNRASRRWPWLLGALFVALLAAWFLVTFKRVEQTIDLPPRGEASYNPLYALKRLLVEQGLDVQSRQRLQLGGIRLARRDTVVVYSDPRTLAKGDVARLLAFAEAGGHVILRLPEWTSGTQDADAGELADGLPIRARLRLPACAHLRFEGEAPERQFCGSARFALDDGARILAGWHDEHPGYVFARFPHGNGSVDLLSDLDLLANDALLDRPHTLFARQLLAPNWGAGTVHLIYAADMPPLWRWLLDHAWRALLPGFLGLLAWLWLRSQRFGPSLPSPLRPRRSLLEHVDASGEHLLRYGQLGALHAALRQAVLDRLRRRDPLAAAQEGDTQARLLAASTGLDAGSIRTTLDSRPPADVHDFRQRISRLIDLRKRL